MSREVRIGKVILVESEEDDEAEQQRLLRPSPAPGHTPDTATDDTRSSSASRNADSDAQSTLTSSSSSSVSWRHLLLTSFVSFIVGAVLALLWLLWQRSLAPSVPLSSHRCEWEFDRYAPSEWEREWSLKIESLYRSGVCPSIMSEVERSFVSQLTMQRWQSGDRPAKGLRGPKATWMESGLPEPHNMDVEKATWIAEQLMSRMHYQLRCTSLNRSASAAADSSSSPSPAPPSFIVARGFELIDPLVGLLRDPFSVCADVPTIGGEYFRLLALISGERWYAKNQRQQGKLFLLPLPAAPFHVRTLSVEEIMQQAGAPQQSSLASSVRAAIEGALAKLVGSSTAPLPPWTLRSIPHSEPVASDWPFLHPPRGEVYARHPQSRSDGSRIDPPIWTLLSEEQQHTALLLQIHDTLWNRPTATVSLPISARIAPLTLEPRASDAAAAAGVPFSDPVRSAAAPRHLLFDFGASYFGGWNTQGKMVTGALGSKWLYDQMHLRGLTFDHVWAFEHEVLDPHLEWSQIPAELYAHFTFVNAGVEADPHSPANPWNTLLAVARHSDFVVLKLDIDTPVVENGLLDQLLRYPALQRLVDEMYFEHHVHVAEMMAPWKPEQFTNFTLADTYRFYTRLRQLGVRMHSWP